MIRAVAVLACVALATLASSARAQDVVRDAAPARRTLAVDAVVEAGASLRPDALRAAIVRELGLELADVEASAASRLRVVLRGRRATVSFTGEGAAGTTRVVDVPADKTVAVEVVALVAANLARDEAGELVLALQARRARGADADDASGAAPSDSPPSPEPPPSTADATTPLAAPPPPPPPPRPTPPPPPTREPCSATTGPWVLGADVVPFAGTSSFARGRASVRILGLGVAADLGRGVRGADLAGAVAIATEGVCGAQLAGAVSVARDVVGVSSAGALSYAGSLRGVQAAPINVAYRVTGAQIGVANVTLGHVRGLQLGLVNVADRADAAVGVVSIQRHGRTNVEAWGSTSGHLVASVVHGGAVVHNHYGAGVRLGSAGTHFTPVLGIGVRVVTTKVVDVDVDALAIGLLSSSWSLESQLRVPVAFHVTRGLAVFAAPTLSVLTDLDGGARSQAPFGESLSTSDVRGWVGAVAGVRVF